MTTKYITGYIEKGAEKQAIAIAMRAAGAPKKRKKH